MCFRIDVGGYFQLLGRKSYDRDRQHSQVFCVSLISCSRTKAPAGIDFTRGGSRRVQRRDGSRDILEGLRNVRFWG